MGDSSNQDGHERTLAAPAHPAESAPAAARAPALSPDVAEEWEPFDDIVPTRGYPLKPMVGLGGSAGSIKALQELLSKMPEDNGMVFVVVVHLSPQHESTLPELLQRSTRMPVVQAQDHQKVEADHVYVIPPGKHLIFAEGFLRLVDLEPEYGRRVAVDLFFRTLADTHGASAIAVVLSGAAGDGAIGIKRIKERGGLTIAQDPDEAEHSGMPLAAIKTAMVDWILPVADMPMRLLDYLRRREHVLLPSEHGPQPAKGNPSAHDEKESALRDILTVLRKRTGHDFSYYKRATILRRVARRMQVTGVSSLAAYLAHLRANLGETGSLQQDLLISVTNFFRDREAFDALAREIPRMFRGKGPDDAVRIWVPACATGEEAYSIAMLLSEHAATLEQPPVIQVFATDLDDEVLQVGRGGIYPGAITADVSEDRLRRFFVREQDSYRIRREMRERVLFAVHDLLKDSPFSRLDLISCRNLLIYLDREAQGRAFDIFHFALRGEARLFLGTSESAPEDTQLFSVVDKKQRIYARQEMMRASFPLLGCASVSLADTMEPRTAGKDPVVHGRDFPPLPVSPAGLAAAVPGPSFPPSLSNMHLRLMERYGPAAAIVNRRNEVVHLSEQAGQYLHFAAGAPTTDLLQLVHPLLRTQLRTALFRAMQTHAPVETSCGPLEIANVSCRVDIQVAPAREIAPDLLLVLFQSRATSEIAPALAETSPDAVVQHLERELDQTKAHLRDTIEQYEAGAEELKASNEELQAINEELRSATEELETSREELQSINEELNAVNIEMKGKVEELGHANSDLHNLMVSTAIPTIFLDRELRIVRYTPAAVSLFNLISSDTGRPLTDLQIQIDYPELVEDAHRVLETLVPIEREVGGGGRHTLARVLPYRTLDFRISGIVLTFVDITETRRTQEALRQSEEQLRLATAAAGIYGWEVDLETKEVVYGVNAARVLSCKPPTDGIKTPSVVHPDDAEAVKTALEAIAGPDQPLFAVEYRWIHPGSGETLWLSAHGQVTPGRSGTGRRLVGISQDVTQRKRAEEELIASEESLRLIIENAREYAIVSFDLDHTITHWNAGAERLLGYADKEIIGKKGDIIFTPEDRELGVPDREVETAIAQGRAQDERWHLRKDGSRFWGSGMMMAMHNRTGRTCGLVKIFRDGTEDRLARGRLEVSRQNLQVALQDAQQARSELERGARAKDQFLAVLSHELRTPLTPILMAVHTLKRRNDLPEEALNVFEMIRRNVELEAHFIDELLDLTRIEKGKLELVDEQVDVHEAVRAAVEIVRGEAEAKGHRVKVELEAAEHVLRGDSKRLQQVFWNLFKNASKFTPDGGDITIRSHNDAGQVVIEVADGGIGFDPAIVNSLFEPFSQADRGITQRHGGLGLGLAIAKATITAHHGKLTAHSEGLGRGARFVVELPLVRPA